MAAFNVIVLLVSGWAIGDVITGVTLFLNRSKIRSLVRQYVSNKEQLAVAAYIRSQAEAEQFAGEDEYGEHLYEGCGDDDCENCNF